MSEPIVFISHFKVKEGKLDGLKQFPQATTECLSQKILIDNACNWPYTKPTIFSHNLTA